MTTRVRSSYAADGHEPRPHRSVAATDKTAAYRLPSGLERGVDRAAVYLCRDQPSLPPDVGQTDVIVGLEPEVAYPGLRAVAICPPAGRSPHSRFRGRCLPCTRARRPGSPDRPRGPRTR